MVPKIIRRDVMSNVNYSTLHDIACHHVEQRFQSMGEIPPTWIISMKPDVFWIETQFKGEKEKVFTFITIRNLMKEFGADCYAFISEAWMCAVHLLPKEERDYWISFMQERGLQDMPEKYRDDIVQVFSFDRNENYLASHYLVTIRKNALNFIGPRINEQLQGLNFKGRMWNLLKE